MNRIISIDVFIGKCLDHALYRCLRSSYAKDLDKISCRGLGGLRMKLKTHRYRLYSAFFRKIDISLIRDPIFVVGAPRSGTTFLGSCLSVIPSICYFYEPPYTKAVGYAIAGGEVSERFARHAFEGTFSRLMALKGTGRFCEKTPTNVFIMTELKRWFPTAKFIHIVRDGVDVAASHVDKGWLCKKSARLGLFEEGGYRNGPIPQFWVDPNRHTEFRSTSDFHRSIWAWRTHVEAGIAQGRLLGGDSYLEIRYEDLIQQQDLIGEQIIDFLGKMRVADKEAFLKGLMSASHASIGKGRRVATSLDCRWAEKEAGDLLRHLGYQDPNPL